ncbi:class I SAM-dependent methyltransferase [Rhodococcus sp. X156]|uniref:class I SAM-dependent methyltransferase n=1 Tax=Rhodococcus sp. X156 TaxID=2499145 RepID=UPI000FD99581|nr:class I SAM-dependent methyltransferase [Rhodococcus sp. X156]
MTSTDPSTVQANLNEYWTARSAPYDEYQERPERREADRAAWTDIWRDALPAAPADVLDVGTGSGYVARVIADLGHRVVGTDLAEGMLGRARQHAERMTNPPRFERGDAVAPDFPAGSFDAVVNRYVMWTLRDPAQALTRWHELLRDGGVLAVVDSTWFPQGLHTGASPEFARLYDEQVRQSLPLAEATSIDATVAAVEAAGFDQVTATPLTRMLELDQRYGVAPNHEVQVQHLITGRARKS